MSKKRKKRPHNDQHYVPKCCLKGWLEDAIPAGSTRPSFVWVFDEYGSDGRRESPGKLFTQEEPVMRGVGVLNRAIEITMPLSSRQCILFTHAPVAPKGYVDVSLELVSALNARQIGYADKSFVSRSPVTRPEWFAKPPLRPDAWENSPAPDRWAHPDSPWDADGSLKQQGPA